jgi:DNA polymerase-3 subunit epsilon
MQLGLFHQGYRAAADVWATVNLLAQSLPDGNTTGVLELVTRAGQPTLKVEACDAPLPPRTRSRRGYRWHVARRIWWSEIATADEAAERQWLAQVC